MERKINLTIRKKILIGYGLGLCLTVAVIVWSLINLTHLGDAAAAILKDNYKSILAAQNMLNDLQKQDSTALLLLLDRHGQAVEQFRESESNFLLWLGRAKDNITIAGEKAILDNISGKYNDYLVSFSHLQSIADTDPAKAADYYHNNMQPSLEAVRQECRELSRLNHDTMFQTSGHAGNIADRAFWSVFTIGSISVVIGFGFSFILAAIIVKPVHQIIEATRQIAEGNYDVEVKANRRDELGAMAKDFNGMVKKLKAYRDLNLKQILSEKHKSEAIIRSIDDGLIVINSEFKIDDINPATAKIFNKTAEEIKGRHILEIIKDEKLFDHIRQAFEPQTVHRDDDQGDNILTVEKGTSQLHYLFSAIPVAAGQESVVNMVLLLRDITRLKKLDMLKSEFVMAASHELRTPLTSIGMSISLLKERSISKLNEQETELLLVADEEVQRLKALINDLLDISKIEAGRMEMDFDMIDVKMLFEKAFIVMKNQVEEKTIELTYKIQDNLPQIKADGNKITWVLTNLISNSLRYTDRGGYIRLSAEKIGAQIHISATDNGEGIPYEYQSRIFDKFVQVKSDKAVGGSGLGLAICKEIIRAHGGTIWVDSQPGKGSTFTFTIPTVEK